MRATATLMMVGLLHVGCSADVEDCEPGGYLRGSPSCSADSEQAGGVSSSSLGSDAADATGAPQFSDFVNTQVELGGELVDFVPGTTLGTTAWLSQQVDRDLQLQVHPVEGVVEDYEEGGPVSGQAVRLTALGGGLTGDDSSDTSTASGEVGLETSACTPVAERVSDALDGSRLTTRVGRHFVPPDDGLSIAETFTSVSEVTADVLHSLLGASRESGYVTVAGHAYDVARDAGWELGDGRGLLTGAQVIVYTETGSIPRDLRVHYFENSWPDRTLSETSSDGLWIALGVPPGRLRIELWGRVDGELVVLGSNSIDAEPDGYVLVDLYAGFSEAHKAPEACLR